MIENVPAEREKSIREECFISSTAGEEFISPDKGGVGKDLGKLTDRSLVDLGVIEEKLNVSHLDKDTQNIVRNIEKKRRICKKRKKGRKLFKIYICPARGVKPANLSGKKAF